MTITWSPATAAAATVASCTRPIHTHTHTHTLGEIIELLQLGIATTENPRTTLETPILGSTFHVCVCVCWFQVTFATSNCLHAVHGSCIKIRHSSHDGTQIWTGDGTTEPWPMSNDVLRTEN